MTPLGRRMLSKAKRPALVRLARWLGMKPGGDLVDRVARKLEAQMRNAHD